MADQGTKYLEVLSMLDMMLKKLDAGTRTQVPKSVAVGISREINMVMDKLTVVNTPLWVVDYAKSVESIAASDVTYLSNNMKQSIVEGLEQLKTEVAKHTYVYYSTHDFTPREKTIPLLREVVRLYHK